MGYDRETADCDWWKHFKSSLFPNKNTSLLSKLGQWNKPIEPLQKGETRSKSVQGVTLICIWRGSSPKALKNGKYSFIAITPRFTLAQIGSTS